MTTFAPVAASRTVALEVLGANAIRFSPSRVLRLVRCRHLQRSGQNASVLCPCDNGFNNCLAAVTLKCHRFRLEGWLLAELYVGQCPHCQRIYWG